ncbi:MAG: N-acetyl-gamma-glutamyl-phosphate reductase [Rhodospirillaceae bacterium]|nr:MAG: N-acetyl-gamma-glutamyl-phosphate reductase [Rhodospirillaceae bacterium]
MRDSSAVRVAILGASGYTGAELVRLLARHPGAEICVLTADRRAGGTLGGVFPHLAGLSLPDLVRLERVKWSNLEVVFCALPHGTTQGVVAALPHHLKVIDLSADLRFADVETYARWYGQAHKAPELQKEVVYGLPELARSAIRTARLVACPGCYPTSVQLPLVPLLAAGLIATEGIIIDSKSGVSGAGRAVKGESLFCEVTEGLQAYSIASHRHAPEIEQGLSQAVGRPVIVTFTPHLVPMSRGILSTLYVRLIGQTSADDLRAALVEHYAGAPFVRVVPAGVIPQTHHVRGSNFCLIGVFADRVPRQAILCAVIDNLVKGAAGQAVQNFNLMTDQPETLGLEQQPLFP